MNTNIQEPTNETNMGIEPILDSDSEVEDEEIIPFVEDAIGEEDIQPESNLEDE